MSGSYGARKTQPQCCLDETHPHSLFVATKSTHMKKAIVLFVLLLSVGAVAFMAYEAYQASADSGAGMTGGGRPGTGATQSAMIPLVSSSVATEDTLQDKVQLVGSLKPIARVQIMSKIAGRVEEVIVDVGDSVKAGQLVARVEDREILQEIEQGEASLAVAAASIHQREAELANLTRQVERYRELHEQALISKQDLEDLMTREQSAKALLELSRAQLRQAEANLNQFRISLDNTRSNSPLDGFVAQRFLHPGALVTANTPILDLVDLRTLRMVINVVERDIVRVRRGVSANVSVDAFPGRIFSGKVLRVSPVLDPATRTGEVEIHVPNLSFDLRAEMFARVTLNLGDQQRGILVPRDALVYEGNQSGVFVIEQGVARFRPVELGLMLQTAVQVIRGLQPGEAVVTMGSSLLKDGDQVRLKEAAPSATERRKREGLFPPVARTGS